MPSLRYTIVGRGGSSARRWYQSIKHVRVDGKGGMRISFTIPAGGKGDTDLSVGIGSKDFPLLLRAMSASDSPAAMAYVERAPVAVGDSAKFLG